MRCRRASGSACCASRRYPDKTFIVNKHIACCRKMRNSANAYACILSGHASKEGEVGAGRAGRSPAAGQRLGRSRRAAARGSRAQGLHRPRPGSLRRGIPQPGLADRAWPGDAVRRHPVCHRQPAGAGGRRSVPRCRSAPFRAGAGIRRRRRPGPARTQPQHDSARRRRALGAPDAPTRPGSGVSQGRLRSRRRNRAAKSR